MYDYNLSKVQANIFDNSKAYIFKKLLIKCWSPTFTFYRLLKKKKIIKIIHSL